MTDRYHPHSEQVALVHSLCKSMPALLPLSRLHESRDESSQSWKHLERLGVFGISTNEEHGGSGLGAAEEALVVLELGRRVVAPSVLATLGATHLPWAANRLLKQPAARVAAGYLREKRCVFIEDAAATLLLLRSESAAKLFTYPASSRSLDQHLWSSHLCESDEPGELLAEATPAEVLRLRLLDAAVLAGIARAAQDMAVDYAGVREQFGRAIGSFQALKHHCANVALAARLACDQVSFAAVALDDRRADAALQVESALYVAGSAAIDNCAKNIQIHGGIGFSDEADPQLLLKRARVFLEIAGGLERALERIVDCSPATALSERAQGQK